MDEGTEQHNEPKQDSTEQKKEGEFTGGERREAPSGVTGGIPNSTSPDMQGRPIERNRGGARGTAAMDPQTRKEVARKGGIAVSRNKEHMAEIGRKGGQSVSQNRDHMATIGRKGGSAARGRGSESS